MTFYSFYNFGPIQIVGQGAQLFDLRDHTSTICRVNLRPILTSKLPNHAQFPRLFSIKWLNLDTIKFVLPLETPKEFAYFCTDKICLVRALAASPEYHEFGITMID